MKVAIITEGGINKGFGHLSRCVALSQALKAKGAKTDFFVNGDDSIKAMLKGEKLHRFNWLKEKQKLYAGLRKYDIAVIDSYLAGREIYKKISGLVKPAVYLDDYKRIDYPEGIIVNGAISARSLRYRTGKIRLLLGPEFALLRKGFLNFPTKKIKKQVKTILIIFGGGSANKTFMRAVKFIQNQYPLWVKNVIVSKRFEDEAEIKNLRGKNTFLHFSIFASSLQDMMFVSDIAISAGGQVLNELCCSGVPTIVICTADNQKNNIRGYIYARAIEYIGKDNSRKIILNLQKALEKLSGAKARAAISGRAQSVIDGRGASRVAELLSRIHGNQTKAC